MLFLGPPPQAIIGTRHATFQAGEWPGPLLGPIGLSISISVIDARGRDLAVACLATRLEPGNSEVAMTDHNRTADGPVSLEKGTIVDRGRGPEIAGTRITIYTVMDFLKADYPLPEIARELSLTDEQAREAVEYIRSHQADADREYGRIMERMNQPNPPEVEQGCARTPEGLRERIKARIERNGAHDRPVGQ